MENLVELLDLHLLDCPVDEDDENDDGWKSDDAADDESFLSPSLQSI